MSDVAPIDPRRRYWLIGYVAPALAPALLVFWMLGLSASLVAFLPLILLFGVAPIVDHMIGKRNDKIFLRQRFGFENRMLQWLSCTY